MKCARTCRATHRSGDRSEPSDPEKLPHLRAYRGRRRHVHRRRQGAECRRRLPARAGLRTDRRSRSENGPQFSRKGEVAPTRLRWRRPADQPTSARASRAMPSSIAVELVETVPSRRVLPRRADLTQTNSQARLIKKKQFHRQSIQINLAVVRCGNSANEIGDPIRDTFMRLSFFLLRFRRTSTPVHGESRRLDFWWAHTTVEPARPRSAPACGAGDKTTAKDHHITKTPRNTSGPRV